MEVGLEKSYAQFLHGGVKAKVELKSRIPIGANH
jgi:hypothetical protein